MLTLPAAAPASEIISSSSSPNRPPCPPEDGGVDDKDVDDDDTARDNPVAELIVFDGNGVRVLIILILIMLPEGAAVAALAAALDQYVDETARRQNAAFILFAMISKDRSSLPTRGLACLARMRSPHDEWNEKDTSSRCAQLRTARTPGDNSRSTSASRRVCRTICAPKLLNLLPEKESAPDRAGFSAEQYSSGQAKADTLVSHPSDSLCARLSAREHMRC